MAPLRRLPISARHAFALAFDLAVRRDAVQSLLVPFLLHTPWLAARAVLPAPDDPEGMTARNLLLHSVVTLGEFLVSLLVAGMLRFRARSVFNTPPGTPAASALECYVRAVARLPWLFVTELMRNLALFGAGLFLVLPGVWVGFRLSLATEAVVLRETTAFGAFSRSFQLTPGRLERWLELIVMSVTLALTLLFMCVVLFLALPSTSWSLWVNVGLFVLPMLMTVIQYAWTFFYLRLEEIDVPHAGAETGHAETPARSSAAAAAPRLTVVEGGRSGDEAGR